MRHQARRGSGSQAAFLGWRARAGDGCSLDGERVQGGGVAAFLYGGGGEPPGTAVIVTAAAQLGGEAARIVASHAATATRPDWDVAPYLVNARHRKRITGRSDSTASSSQGVEHVTEAQRPAPGGRPPAGARVLPGRSRVTRWTSANRMRHSTKFTH